MRIGADWQLNPRVLGAPGISLSAAWAPSILHLAASVEAVFFIFGCATNLWGHSRKLSQCMTSRRPCSVSFSLRRQACHVGGLADRSRRHVCLMPQTFAVTSGLDVERASGRQSRLSSRLVSDPTEFTAVALIPRKHSALSRPVECWRLRAEADSTVSSALRCAQNTSLSEN